jgi:hypothetical protein
MTSFSFSHYDPAPTIKKKLEMATTILPGQIGPFACSFCPNVFEMKEVLEVHVVAVHAGVNMNKENVSVTAKVVPSAINLIAETLPATGNSYYDCNICFNVFGDEDSLEKHVHSVHSPDQEIMDVFQLDDDVSYDFVFRQTQNQVGNEVFMFMIYKTFKFLEMKTHNPNFKKHFIKSSNLTQIFENESV